MQLNWNKVAQARHGKTRKEVRYIAGSVDVTENNRGEGEIRATVSADVTENNGGEGDLRATLTAHEAENTEVESELRATLTAADRTENTVVERDDKNATGDQSHNLKYISKYLVQFVPDAKPQKTETSVRISGARVLTSEKCVSILKTHAVCVLNHFKVMMKWKIGYNVLVTGGYMKFV